jgi:hypothetical protein
MIQQRVGMRAQGEEEPGQEGRPGVGPGRGSEAAERRREERPRWGVVSCPDGPHRTDLYVVRRVMTRLLVAGELGYDVSGDLARKAGVSRSTVSRMLAGRRVGVRTVQAVLGVLKLSFEAVVSEAAMPAEGSAE